MNNMHSHVKLRISKETNKIVSGISPSTRVSEAQLVTNLLADELNVTTVVTHCLKLGKPNVGRPQLLLNCYSHPCF